jgi:hypothetical protein
MSNYISKSDFKVARECATKLYYKKLEYPNTNECNEYLQLLAEGGYIVGKMAQLMYPSGIEIQSERGSSDALNETENLLKQENVILFEPAIWINNKLIRIDILEKKGNVFNLIEVKAKSFDGELRNEQFWNKRSGEIKTDWQAYLEDVTYQALVLKERFPEAHINSFLMMPDKSKSTNIDGLAKWFRISETKQTGKFKGYKVDFSVFYSQDSIANAESQLKSGKSKIVVENGQIVKVSKDKDNIVSREVLTKKWTDWIDYWSVDFDWESKKEIIQILKSDPVQYKIDGSIDPTQIKLPEIEEIWTGDYVFENEWQSFRTKKNRSLEMTSVSKEVEPGRRKLAIKVVDIFGNDTMKIIDVHVGGGKKK